MRDERQREVQVWKSVAGMFLSPSHGVSHVRRVQEYAQRLCDSEGVDPELVRIAAILHDLGRGDDDRRHGLESIAASREIAERVLAKIDLSREEREAIVEAIETHDQPGLRPPTLIGRILKDADFLAGFGAWGVLRIAMWSGETGRSMESVRKKITEGMQRRADSLEFQASRDVVHRELLLAQFFDSELERPALVKSKDYPGFYIVLEGVSGSGKNTVAKAISTHFKDHDTECHLVEEPGATFRMIRDSLDTELPGSKDTTLRKALLMADRAVQVERDILPKLRNGEVVVSVRSYLSTAVYQGIDDRDAWLTMMAYEWMPMTDLLIVLDVGVEDALSRISNRSKPRGEFETQEDLTIHRQRYLKYSGFFPARHRQVLDASQGLEQVISDALTVLQKHTVDT